MLLCYCEKKKQRCNATFSYYCYCNLNNKLLPSLEHVTRSFNHAFSCSPFLFCIFMEIFKLPCCNYSMTFSGCLLPVKIYFMCSKMIKHFLTINSDQEYNIQECAVNKHLQGWNFHCDREHLSFMVHYPSPGPQESFSNNIGWSSDHRLILGNLSWMWYVVSASHLLSFNTLCVRLWRDIVNRSFA